MILLISMNVSLLFGIFHVKPFVIRLHSKQMLSYILKMNTVNLIPNFTYKYFDFLRISKL